MMKQRLPNNWITVSSKTHPDRVYYFNVRTKQSSWTEPALDEANKVFYLSVICNTDIKYVY